MNVLERISAQSSALSLLRSGGGVFGIKKDPGTQTSSLLIALDGSGSDATTALEKKNQQSQNILRQLESSRSDMNEQRKAAAAEKVQRIKQKLATLRLIASINPQAAAKQAAQLSRELAQAVREYSASSGGTGTPLPAATAPVATGGEKGNAATADAATAGQLGEAATDKEAQISESAAEAPPANTESVRQSLEEIEKEEEKNAQDFRAQINEQVSSLAQSDAKSQADAQFAKEAEDVKNALKKIIESVKRKLQEKENNSADEDIRVAENALREVEGLTASIASMAIAVTAAPVNMLV